MTKAFLFLARITGRLYLWRATVFIYSVGANSFAQMKSSVGFLVYALMMCRESLPARAFVVRLIRRERNRSAENNLWLAKLAWILGRPALAILLFKRTEALFPEHKDEATVSSLRRFAEGVDSGAIPAQLEAAIEALPLPESGSRPIILTMVSKRFFDLFKIWFGQVRQHTSAYPLVFALDRETVDALRGEPDCGVVDVSKWFHFDEAGRLHPFSTKNLWVLRVLALRVLARRNYDIASLDVDAILIGNLDEMLKSFPDSDIVAQTDYSIPMDVARRFGFILCCGFLVLRANERTIHFLDAYCAKTALESDDQLALNHLLAGSGIGDRVKTERYATFRSMGLSWLCPDSSLVSRDIRHGSVVRHFLLKNLSAGEVAESLGLRKPGGSGAADAAPGIAPGKTESAR